MLKNILVFVLAAVLSFLLTPIAKKIAYKIGAIDVPKDTRRVHKKPTPRLGGLAIFASFVVTTILFNQQDYRLTGVLLGATIIVVMGIFDDTKPLPAKLKFAVQIFAALIVVASGIKITYITNPLAFMGYKDYITFGWLSIPITILWIVGVTNAINLIDGLDGLAAGVSSIGAMTLFAVSTAAGSTAPAVMLATLTLAGAAAGFLPHNFNPAKIFMGDTGALFLGYMLGVLSIMGVMKGAAMLSILVPILAIGFPIFDTLFAMIRRYLNGRPIMEADKGHLHHRLMEKGLSQRQTVLILYAISIGLGTIAFAIVQARLNIAGALIFILFLCIVWGIKYFGLMEIKND